VCKIEILCAGRLSKVSELRTVVRFVLPAQRGQLPAKALSRNSQDSQITKTVVLDECPKCAGRVSKMGKERSQEPGVRMRTGKAEDWNKRHYAQRVSKLSGMLSKIKKRISLCHCASVVKIVQNVQVHKVHGYRIGKTRCAERLSKMCRCGVQNVRIETRCIASVRCIQSVGVVDGNGKYEYGKMKTVCSECIQSVGVSVQNVQVRGVRSVRFVRDRLSKMFKSMIFTG